MFYCRKFAVKESNFNEALGRRVSPENIVVKMLRSATGELAYSNRGQQYRVEGAHCKVLIIFSMEIAVETCLQ